MNSKPSIILLCLVCLALAGRLTAASSSNLLQSRMETDDFRASGSATLLFEGAPHRLAWQISGRQAIVNLPDVRLQNFSLDFSEPDSGYRLDLSSPSCHFDQNSRKITSNSPLLISTSGMEISGIGYDIFLDKESCIITIRQAVDIRIHRKELNKLLPTRDK